MWDNRHNRVSTSVGWERDISGSSCPSTTATGLLLGPALFSSFLQNSVDIALTLQRPLINPRSLIISPSSSMDRVNAFMGRLIRRQLLEDTKGGGITIPLPTLLPTRPRRPRQHQSRRRPPPQRRPKPPNRRQQQRSGTSTTTTQAGDAKPTDTTTTSTSTSTSTTTSSTPTTTSTTAGGVLVTTQAPDLTSTVTERPTTSTTFVSQTVSNAGQQSSTPSQIGGAKSSFLDNKVAAGVTFGISGFVGLVLILFIIWFAMRKRRRIAKLEKDIISFDPDAVGNYRRSDSDIRSLSSVEKGRSNSSLDHYAGNGYAATMNADSQPDYRNAAPYSDYGPQRNGSLQRPGNVAFNPTADSGDYTRKYALPSQTYNTQPYNGYNR
ncbi:hypothetical protein DFP72DRAFT_603922 [Ephemerocybe angulata]|uniref:Mid2 domain-containing protein n=1 Tax=Ephemerocybe angulata TaxID=980116 RepID=A0A8H6IDA4_9AGAR|nr:hypothetical protein DFP72DRAFT_603922 [Tulosesus angulatus]